MATIELKKLSKTYADSKELAVNQIDLTVNDKEFVVLVGPSGCGKSTTLRMIAGLEKITAGELYINHQLMNYVKPENRNLSMVFQSYALFPHMTVADNIAFGLNVGKTKKTVVKEKVAEVSKIVGLEDYLQRKPKELSGGQKQRVALGRAIIKGMNLILMDEPLSNLDAKLRTKMREEITSLHRKLGATTVYVTHDQVEAMTMATKIVVLNRGMIQQVGTPLEIYEEPKNQFVAGFMGTPSMNLLDMTVVDGQICLGSHLMGTVSENLKENKYTFGIRPEKVQISKEGRGTPAKIEYVERLGAELLVHFSLEGIGQTVVGKVPAIEEVEQGDSVTVDLKLDQGYLFDTQTEQTVFSRGKIGG